MSFKLKSRWLNRTQETMETGNSPVSIPNVKVEQSPERPKFTPILENIFTSDGSKHGSKGSKDSKRMLCDCSTSPEERLDGKPACGEECLNRILFIEWGQFVMEYVGEVLNAGSFRHRTKRYGRDASHKHHYFMALRNDEVIDATEKGNVSRFINHSCDPNCETQKWTVNGMLRIGFFTKKDISSGDEITFDYQFERYGKEAQKCYCGSEKCRGYIGGRPSEEEKMATKEALREHQAREKRRKAQLEDMAMEKQLNELVTLGQLRTRDQILDFCRLMVRGEEFQARMKLLDVLMNTEEPLLRLFLDYHGCWLIWSWMVDDENLDGLSMSKLHKKLLLVLQKLPIPHRNMLEDSRVLKVVRRWADSSQNESDSLRDDVGYVVRRLVDCVVSSVPVGRGGSGSPPSSSSSPVNESGSSGVEESGNQMDEERLLRKEISALSQRLISGPWAQLKEYFKIPKKTEAGKAARVSRRPLSSSSQARFLSRQSNLAPKHSSAILRYNQNNAARTPLRKQETSRSQSGSRSPPSVRKGKASPAPQKPMIPSLIIPASSDMKDSKPETPVGQRKRRSRFDRRTPPYPPKSTPDEPSADLCIFDRRKEFELSMTRESEDEQQRLMSLEFQMARESVLDFEGVDNDDMDVDEEESAASMDVCTSVGLGHHVTTSEGDGEALPALMVPDPHTWQYWWQDQASGTLVYPVSEAQMAAIGQDDWSVTPHFVYNANTGLIHEVKLDILPPPAAPALAQDPVVSSSESGISPAIYSRWEDNQNSGSGQEAAGSSVSQDSVLERKEERLALLAPPEMDPRQQVEFLKEQIAILEKRIEEEERAKMEETPAMVPPPSKLPPNWKTAKDEEGSLYYYNTETRESQWETPKEEEVSETAPTLSPLPIPEEQPRKAKAAVKHKLSASEASPAKKFRPETTTAAADTSSEVGKKQRDKFKSEMSSYVIKCLHPYQKADCKMGRITSSEDFKHLARKLSHTVMEKELKHTSRMEDLRVTDSVKAKAKDYIKKYMKKIGPEYRRTLSASGRRSLSPCLLEMNDG